MSENKPLVSILMNCRNGEEFLREAIDSVYAQTHENWEIIFWDNLSTDSSAEIAKSYDHRLKYFLATEATSLYKARNLAVEKCNGEFLAILDTDDIWLPEKLEKQISAFKKPEIAGVFSDAIYFTTHSEWLLYKTRDFHTGKCFDKLISGNFIASPSLLYRMEAVQNLDHVFDERFNMSGDWDLSLRLSLGNKLECVNEPLVKYRLHDNNLSKKMPQAIIDEMDIMIEKYSKLIPGFKSKYANELKVLQEEKDMVLAQAYWSSGDTKEARKIYFKNISSPKSFLFYLSTFMPHEKFVRLKGAFRKFLY